MVSVKQFLMPTLKKTEFRKANEIVILIFNLILLISTN